MDNNIFTIGDKTNYGTIRKFVIIDNKIKVLFKEDLLDTHYTDLHYIQHCKKPVFKTEDSVEIFEKDEYYIVYDNNYSIINKNECENFKTIKTSTNDESKILDLENKSIHRFSTKEAAEKWILMNKPSLSINDIFDNYEKDGMLDFMKFSNKLIKLVKSKS